MGIPMPIAILSLTVRWVSASTGASKDEVGVGLTMFTGKVLVAGGVATGATAELAAADEVMVVVAAAVAEADEVALPIENAKLNVVKVFCCSISV